MSMLKEWPEARRRYPSLSSGGYLVLKPLSLRIQKKCRELSDRGVKDLRIVDIGCGMKPYYPFFASISDKYIGIDMPGVPRVEIYGDASSIPLKDCTADIVLCFQVLEHIRYPEVFIRDVERILRPGGMLLLSTHGTMVYHPYPGDYWRWTHEGLQAIFERSGLIVNKINPLGENGAALAFLFATQVEFLLQKRKITKPLKRLLVPLINVTGLCCNLFMLGIPSPQAYSISANYLVEASKSPTTS